MNRLCGASEVVMLRQGYCAMQETQIKGHTENVSESSRNIISGIDANRLILITSLHRLTVHVHSRTKPSTVAINSNASQYSYRRARILVADNHREFADNCGHMLEAEFHVVRIVTDGSKLGQSIKELRPDVVIIDMVMPPLNGFDLGELVKSESPDAKVIYMTVAASLHEAAEAFQRGGSAYISKFDFPEALLAAVRCVVRGDLYLSSILISGNDRPQRGCWRQGQLTHLASSYATTRL